MKITDFNPDEYEAIEVSPVQQNLTPTPAQPSPDFAQNPIVIDEDSEDYEIITYDKEGNVEDVSSENTLTVGGKKFVQEGIGIAGSTVQSTGIAVQGLRKYAEKRAITGNQRLLNFYDAIDNAPVLEKEQYNKLIDDSGISGSDRYKALQYAALRRLSNEGKDIPNPEVFSGQRSKAATDLATAQQNLQNMPQAKDTTLYKAGSAITQFGRDIAPVSKEAEEAHPYASMIGGGLGSAAGFVAGGAAGAALKVGSAATAATLGAGVNAASQYEDALNHGANEENALESAFWGGLFGTSEAFPVERLFKVFRSTGTGKILSNSIKEIGKRAGKEGLKQGTVEAAQELFQSVMNNLIASDIVKYDPERQVFEGVGEAAGVGFAVGDIMGTVTSLVTGAVNRRRQGVDPQKELESQIEAQVEQDVDESLSSEEAQSLGLETPPSDVEVKEVFPDDAVAPIQKELDDLIVNDQLPADIDPESSGSGEIEIEVNSGEGTETVGTAMYNPETGEVRLLDESPALQEEQAITQQEPATPEQVQQNLEQEAERAQVDKYSKMSTGVLKNQLKRAQKDLSKADSVDPVLDKNIGLMERELSTRKGQEPESEISSRIIKPDVAVVPQGKDINVEYAVVELDDLIPSHTDNFTPNKVFPQELQPRDRSRASSEKQIQDIANNLDPRLLLETPLASEGAPIIAPSGVVESGNGRIMGMRRAFQNNLPSSQRYKEALEQSGYPIEGIKQPVLVRVRRSQLDPIDRQRFTAQANERTTSSLSSTERAMTDAAMLAPGVLEQFQGGDVSLAKNRPFVRAFMKGIVSDNDMGTMIDSSGMMSQDAIRRVQSALLARAFDDADLVSTIFESQDNDLRTMGDALVNVSANWAQMRSEASEGKINSDVDITSNLLEAINIVLRSRREGQPVKAYVNQDDMFSGSIHPYSAKLLESLYHDPNFTKVKARDKITEYLDAYINEARKTSPGADMFGDQVNAQQILERTGTQYAESQPATEQTDIFRQETPPARTEERANTEPSGTSEDTREPRSDERAPDEQPSEQGVAQESDSAVREGGEQDPVGDTTQKPIQPLKNPDFLSESDRNDYNRLGSVYVGDGDVFNTPSGRKTTPVPKTSHYKAIGTRGRKIDEWLLSNAIAEAKHRRDDFNLQTFEGMNIKNLSPSDKDHLNMYLFDEKQPEALPPILKPLTHPSKQDNLSKAKDTEENKSISKAKPSEPATKPSEQITDFGEKIGGARKDVWQAYNKSLTDALPSSFADVTLAKHFPEPKYQELLDNGADVRVLAAIKAMRDFIPNKPRVSYKLQMWGEKVEVMRDFSAKLISGDISYDRFISEMKGRAALNEVYEKALLYTELGYPLLTKAKDWSVSEAKYSMYKKEYYDPPITKFTAREKSRFGESFDTRQEAYDFVKAKLDVDGATPKKRQTKLDIYRYTSSKEWTIGKKVSSGKYIDLKGDFKSSKEARAYLNENNEDLLSLLEKKKDVKAHRRSTNDPRIGEDYRKGENVTPEKFGNTFGFKGVEFGNYVEQSKRQKDLNNAYDGLMDLANLIGLPPKSLSLNGELSLAFGARGKGGKRAASAHYEPNKVVINLTKKDGAGSLAHEWWHAIDNYFDRQRGGAGYMFESPFITKNDKTRQQVRDAFKDLSKAIYSTSGYVKRSKTLDNTRSKDYWSTGREMSARAFEVYVIDKAAQQERRSDYLANILPEEAYTKDELKEFPYPLQSELSPISGAFDKLFDTIEVDTKKDNAPLYKRIDSEKAGDEGGTTPLGHKDKDGMITIDLHGTKVRMLKEENKRLYYPLAQKIKNELKRVFGDVPNLSFVDELRDNKSINAGGVYYPQHGSLEHVILVALNGNTDLNMGSMYHEGIHFLRQTGALEKDWNTLEELATKKWIEKYNISTLYGANTETQVEEAIAEAFRDYAVGRINETAVQEIFRKISDFFAAITSWLRGRGYRSWRQVFEEIHAGEFAQGSTAQSPIYNAPPAFQRRVQDDLRKLDWHLPDEGILDILRTDNISALDKLKRMARKDVLGVSFNEGRRRMQDRMIAWRKVEERIEAAKGTVLGEAEQVYLQEELATGRIGDKLQKLSLQYKDRIVDKLAILKHKYKVEMDVVEDYLYALHASERNAEIAKINPKFSDGGSGMTNAEAAKIIKETEAHPQFALINETQKLIRTMLDNSLKERVNMGLLTEKAAMMLRSKYKHYVPLRGKDSIDSDYFVMNWGGGGYQAQGSEFKRALGRESRAIDLIANSLSIAEEAIIRGEKNKVFKAVFNLVEKNPNKKLWEINKMEPKYQLNKETGMVEERYFPKGFKADDSTVFGKIDGKMVQITINDKRLAEPMKNIDGDSMNIVFRMLSNLNRFLSYMNTTANPEFMITNAFRDLQAGTINIQQFNLDGVGKDVWKGLPKALKASYGGIQGKGNTEWQKYFREFAEEGGRVSFWSVDDIQSQRTNLKKAINLQGNNTLAISERGARATVKFIEDVNLTVEHAIRISTYVAVRKRGMSKAQAAQIAKNITVNFNKRGSFAPAMNSLYLFYNAGVQGTVVILKALRHSKRVRRIAGSLIGFGIAGELMNTFLSPEDDDGQLLYDKIPHYVKSTNMIIMDPTGMLKKIVDGILPYELIDDAGYIKIPYSYGYMVFPELGRNAAAYLRKSQDMSETLGNIGMSVLHNYNPIGGESFEHVLAPTVLDPYISIKSNKDFMDRPILPTLNPFDSTPTPDSQRYFPSIGPTERKIAEFLNDVSGGSKYKSGAIDISPETMDYLFKHFTGAAGAFVKRTVTAADKAWNNEPISVGQVPFARKLVGSKGIWIDRSNAYDRIKHIMRVHGEWKGFTSDGNTEEASKVEKEHAPLIALQPAATELSKSLKIVRRLRQQTEGSFMSEPEKKQTLQELDVNEKQALDDFNRQYLNAVKKSAKYVGLKGD